MFISQKFKGNTNGVTIIFNEVPFPVKTSEVLVVPTHWHKNIALRLELYGCEPGKNSSKNHEKIGLLC